MSEPPSVYPITERLYAMLAPTMVGDADGGYLGLRWLDGIGAMLAPLADLIEDSVAGPGFSSMMDVTRAPTAGLGWLGQFVGVGVDPTDTDAVQRATIMGEAGFKRGTPKAMVAAALPFLQGLKTVHLIERSQDAYTFTLVVYTRDLQGGRWADLIARYATWDDVTSTYATWDGLLGDVGTALEQAIIVGKPAGLVQTLEIASGGSWDDVVANFADWDDVVVNFADWDSLLAWTPS